MKKTKKRIVLGALCTGLLLTGACCMAEGTAPVGQTIETDDSGARRVRLFAQEQPDADTEGAAGILLRTDVLDAILNARFEQDAAQRLFERGAQMEQEASIYSDERIISLGLYWGGEQPKGPDMSRYLTLNLNAETGEEILFETLFTDAEQAIAAMEAMITEDVMPRIGDYMEFSDLLPMPTDRFYMDAYGLTVCYTADRFGYYGGRCGAVQFDWYELEPYLAPEGPAGAAARAAMDTEREKEEERLLAGRLHEKQAFVLGDLLKAAREAGGLEEGDYTRRTMTYPMSEARMRGWSAEILRYADTPEDETPIYAVRSERIRLLGMQTGSTTAEQAREQLGEPEREEALTADTAEEMLYDSPGKRFFYRYGAYTLELYFDEGDILNGMRLSVQTE